jgi:glutamate synthase (NADPH/NADH) small chain
MELGQPDNSGRRRPQATDETGIYHCDTVVSAIGTLAHPHLSEVAQIDRNKWGYLETNESGQTSNPRIFAGGDIVTGAATVILAMGAGKTAAASIDNLIKQG